MASTYWRDLYNMHFTHFLCPLCERKQEFENCACQKCSKCQTLCGSGSLCGQCAKELKRCVKCGEEFKTPAEYLQLVTKYILYKIQESENTQSPKRFLLEKKGWDRKLREFNWMVQQVL